MKSVEEYAKEWRGVRKSDEKHDKEGCKMK